MSDNKPLVLVVEDEPQDAALLAYHVAKQRRWSKPKPAKQGITSQRNTNRMAYSTWGPDVDGIQVTARLREWSHTPIIVLTE